MFNFIHRLFHAKEKAVDTRNINDRNKLIASYLIRFNSNRFGKLIQARKWGK